ncbi:hypothetical protein MMPV_005477 [Pyropia vietnamensis]
MDRLRALLGRTSLADGLPPGTGGEEGRSGMGPGGGDGPWCLAADGCDVGGNGASGGAGSGGASLSPSPSPSPPRRGFPSPRSLRSLTPPRGHRSGSVSPSVSPASGRWAKGGGGGGGTSNSSGDISFPMGVTHTAHGGSGGAIAAVGDASLAPSVVAAARASGVAVTDDNRAVVGAVWRTFTQGVAPPCGEAQAGVVTGEERKGEGVRGVGPGRPVLGALTPAQARAAAAAARGGAVGAVQVVKPTLPPPPPKPAGPVRYIHADPQSVYHLTEVGSGASGKVYRAVRRVPVAGVPDVVALKAVHPSSEVEAVAVASEAAALAALCHPNVVSGNETYAWAGGVWMVMQWMDSGCLTDVLAYLQRRRLLLEEGHIAYILSAAVAGLGALHSGRRLHRDMKSDNLLLDGAGGCAWPTMASPLS